jgi:hypothetical protein
VGRQNGGIIVNHRYSSAQKIFLFFLVSLTQIPKISGKIKLIILPDIAEWQDV